VSKSETSGYRLKLATALIGLVYFVQILTPFRLDNDSVVYLRMGVDIAGGHVPTGNGLPFGYPYFTGTLDRLGIRWSFLFVAANCIFLAAGLASIWYLFVRNKPARNWWIIVLTMLCYVPIKYVTLSLPDPMFFGTSLVTLALLTRAWSSAGSERFTLLTVSALLIGVSMAIRIVGIALIPPFAMCCCFRPDPRGVPVIRGRARNWLLGAGGFAAAGFIAAAAVGQSLVTYRSDAALRYLTTQVWLFELQHAANLVVNTGELLINLPFFRFKAFGEYFFWAGTAILAMLVIGVKFERPKTPAGVYLLTFLAILVMWPYNSSRLWLPIIPLLIAYLMSAQLRFAPTRAGRIALKLCLIWYVFAGTVALAYTTRITFSGANFQREYGVSGGMATPDKNTGWINEEHNQHVRELMRRYRNPF
jgi:hypothetical protein